MLKNVIEVKTKSKVRKNHKKPKQKEFTQNKETPNKNTNLIHENKALTSEEFASGLNSLLQISSPSTFLVILNQNNEESKFYDCLKELVTRQLDDKNHDILSQLLLNTDSQNCFFIKPKEEDASVFLQRIYLTMMEFFVSTPKEIIFLNIMLLQKCLSIFHVLKSKYVKQIDEDIQMKAIKLIFKGINFIFLKNFIDYFDLFNIIKEKYITEILYELRNKPDLAIKYVSLFNVTDKTLLKNILDSCFKEKTCLITIRKILDIDSTFVQYTFKAMLDKNWTKQCTDLYLSLKLEDIELKNNILEKSQIKAFTHYYNEYLGNKINLIHLEELFKGSRVVVKILLIKLINDKRFEDAFYVLKKQNYDVDLDFNKILLIYKSSINTKPRFFQTKEDLIKDIRLLNREFLIEKDLFLPVTPNCLKMSLDIDCVKFVDSEESLKFLDLLMEGSVIGIDCEWKPTISKLEMNTGVSIMQLSNENYACVVDMIKLENNKYFLEKLINVFTNKKVVSFDFENDLQKLNSKFKDIFYSKQVNIESVDLHKILITQYKELKIKSLTDTVKHFLKEPLCKSEQSSNWENRPLRLRQLHYAALDAYVLVMLYNIMTK
jgi:hypothetical protein